MREGKDVVILTYSRMRWTVMQAVTELEKEVLPPPPTPPLTGSPFDLCIYPTLQRRLDAAILAAP